MKMLSEKTFLSSLVQNYYPEVYARIHGSGPTPAAMAVSAGTASEHLSVKDLKTEAKRVKVPYFNWLRRDELIAALEAQRSGNSEAVAELAKEAKKRFNEAWKKYETKGENQS